MALPISAPVPADRPLLAVLRGERRDPPPVWLMRQAGRYLPEYRALRADKGGFLELVNDSAAAAEVTLQPIERFGFDGAILFSDILMIPSALGQDLTFGPGEGPRLSPALVDHALTALEPVMERLSPVYETVRRVRARLPDRTTFLGFAGSPWTVATYMVAGQGSKEQGETRRMAYRDPAAFGAIIDRLVESTTDYLSLQIEAGVDAVQLFDSWSGSLAPREFERWVIAPTRAIVDRLRGRHPDTPIIGFPKGAGGKLPAYARETGVDALGLDETVDPVWANANLPENMPVQGNLDPLALIAGGAALDNAIAAIRGAFPTRPHVFNLGHGILPDTPIAHVEQLLGALAGMITFMPDFLGSAGFLGNAYPWVKAGHVIFVIFWMAGLFMLPRFYIYHQATTPGSAEDTAWIERERRLRSIIITPAMIVVWLFGLTLAFDQGLWGVHWFQAKFATVLALTAFHGWAVGYGRKMAKGYRAPADKALRWMNEIPGIATAIIVILVIVRPF